MTPRFWVMLARWRLRPECYFWTALVAPSEVICGLTGRPGVPPGEERRHAASGPRERADRCPRGCVVPNRGMGKVRLEPGFTVTGMRKGITSPLSRIDAGRIIAMLMSDGTMLAGWGTAVESGVHRWC